jgi:hypothetical protein
MRPQDVPLQVAVPLLGTGHDVQEAPQEATLVSEAQTPPQLWVPAGHTPLQAFALGMHAPVAGHSLVPVGQAGAHASPSHITLPPVGAAHAVHDVRPQLATAVLLTQRPLHRWKFVLHRRPQAPVRHTAAPFGSPGHALHVVPHAAALSSDAQAAPHR